MKEVVEVPQTHKNLIPVLALLLPLLFVGFADAAVYNCSSCADCTGKIQNASAGDTVYLVANLTNYSGSCIEFGATNIEFDCQGYLIEGYSDYSGIQIGVKYMSGTTNNTVKNCIIVGFGRGIYIWQSPYNTLINNTVTSNGYGYGIDLWYSSYNNLTNNNASNNYAGIYLGHSDYNILTNNIANLNNGGVGLGSSSNNTLNSNQVCHNTDSDFYFYIYGGLDNSGDENTCDNPGDWNDATTTGCTYSCIATTTTTILVEECSLVGDTPPCGEVTMGEVIDLIILWSNEQAELGDVLDLIDVWANPTTTTSTTTTSTSTSSTTTTCLGEGEQIMFEPYQVYEVCCPGLTLIRDGYPSERIGRDDYCIYASCSCYICTKCGNGICENDTGENWCSCPGDCPEPEEVPCTTDDECGTDRCWMDDNICYEMVFQCYENGQCSAITTTGSFVNYSCVGISCVPPTTSTSTTTTTSTSTTTTTTTSTTTTSTTSTTLIPAMFLDNATLMVNDTNKIAESNPSSLIVINNTGVNLTFAATTPLNISIYEDSPTGTLLNEFACSTVPCGVCSVLLTEGNVTEIFGLDGLDAERLYLEAAAGASSWNLLNITLGEANITKSKDAAQLNVSTSVQVNVTAYDQPVPGVTIAVRNSTNSTMNSGVTDSNGSVEILLAPTESDTLGIWLNDVPSSDHTISATNTLSVAYTPEDPILGQPILLYVRPYGSTTDLVEDSYVNLRSPGESGYTLYAAANGTYTIQTPIVGTYAIYAVKDGWIDSGIAYIIFGASCNIMTSCITTTSTTSTTTTIPQLAVTHTPSVPNILESLIFYVRPYGNTTAIVENSHLYLRAPAEAAYCLYAAPDGTYTIISPEAGDEYAAYATKEGWTDSDVVYTVIAASCDWEGWIDSDVAYTLGAYDC